MSTAKIPADGFLIFHGLFGFSIGVQQANFPADPQGNVGSVSLAVVEEIRVSPHLAKILLETLSLNIAKYEDTFGVIKGPPMPAPGRAN